VDDAKVTEEFDRRAARQPNIHSVLDAQETEASRRGNLLRDRVTRSAALRLLQPRRRDSVLDFGCGVGRLTLPLAEHAGRVIGVDASANMILAAQARLAEAGHRNVMFQHSPRLPISLDDGSVDKVLCCWVLAHMSDARLIATLKELRRCLRPQGLLVALEQVRDQPREIGSIHAQRSVQEYSRLFAAAGMALEARRPVMRAPSYALALWNSLKWLPEAALPVLDLVERLSVDRKADLADYVTVGMIVRRP